jgi:hypothetical protein
VEAAWPGISDGGFACVYCGHQDATVLAHPLLFERPVCAVCESERSNAGGELERVRHADAEYAYAVDMNSDEAPPPFPGGKRGQKDYLLSQVREYAEEIHGTVEAAMATALRFS